jgi:NAD(P)-dependent dehydrogenase (short-subunit alcohol dehydrogenase family)/glycosyltransferase involved in cell wall biosynthesis
MTVLVPALNEESTLAPTVERLIEALTITIDDFEIIIIDDGSTDNTRAVAERLAAAHAFVRVIVNPRTMGLGYGYTRGFEEATKEFFVYIPGDNTWPYRSFVELFGQLGRADVITSYALNPEVRPFGRRIVSRLYTVVLNLLFGRRMRYFNGLTIYPLQFLRRKPLTTFGFGFQAEVLLKALYSGLSYIEVGLPIDERSAGGSKAVNLGNIASVAGTVVRLFWMLRIRRQWGPSSSLSHSRPIISRGSSISLDELGFDPDIDSVREATDATVASRVIVLTGASSGIGAALAKDLASAGHQVFACSRNLGRLTEVFLDCPQVVCIGCDASKESDVSQFVLAVAEQADHIDVLVNCAGGFGTIGAIDKVDTTAWMQTISDNILSTFLPIKLFLPLLQKSESPQIINFSGGGAFGPFPNFTAYACAKAAIVRLTETLAIELSPYGISVNAIAPGLIRTEAHNATLVAGPERAGAVQFRRTERLMQPNADGASSARLEQVKQCVRALISPAYRGLTGKTISANFDPWATAAFREHIDDIARSELYTMRRTNLVSLPDGLLRTQLMETWAKHGVRR